MYQALVTKIKTKPHPNADKLVLGNVSEYQVVVSNTTQDGQLGVFFSSDGQLSEEYSNANDLVGYYDPQTNEKKGGYFPKNRRVKAQTFRGQKSEGYFAPLESLAFTGYDITQLKEGDKFDQLNNVPICNKYFTPATNKLREGMVQFVRKNKLFPKHVESLKLKDELTSIETGSLLTFTEKLHGTSGRFGYLPEDTAVKRTLLDRLLRRTRVKPQLKYFVGTKNVILADRYERNFYGSEEFRWDCMAFLEGKLFVGEVLYFEIVGYTPDKPIMSPQYDKKGNKMEYSYGLPVGHCKPYVYRITRTDSLGNKVEYSWFDVKRRCKELGISFVPELRAPVVYDGILYHSNYILKIADNHVEGNSTLCDSHIREGVVIRSDSEEGMKIYKYKSHTFGVLEGYLKDEDDYVDLEEIS